MKSELTLRIGPLAFFRKHVNGDYSLGRSFWINGLLIQISICLLGTLLFVWLSRNFQARYASTSILATTFLGFLAWGWALIGIWNSASKNVARGGKQQWTNAAKLLVLLSLFQMPNAIITVIRPLNYHWKVATGFSKSPPTIIFPTRTMSD